MTRTEEQKIKDKLLMLYVMNQMKESGEEVTLDKLQMRILVIQKTLEANNIETFSYDDWKWADDECPNCQGKGYVFIGDSVIECSCVEEIDKDE